ncbi:hypothetical protein HK097_008390 [Rhizophlyctis rosea]|uniref:Glutathione S-transferase kappa n=1 Tax=Rhizophlyctis rosea TaxID=64517 RepID=A0AAD5X1Q7_9FUNG|nr:hypothetical protein HK097_008390 [Rhizophlyctis rosea]
MPVKISLYYDSVSPYSWLAFEVLQRYQSTWGYELSLKPFFLGGIMQGSGNQPPAFIPSKAKYMQSDLPRNGKLFNVPLNFPTAFPVSTLKAQRALTYIKLHHPEKLADASRGLWKSYWSQNKNISLDTDILAVLQPLLPNPDKILTSTSDPQIKDELLRTTKEALDQGAFGAPWIEVEQEDGRKIYFWGSDRFEQMAMVLGKRWYGPLGRVEAKL